MAEGRTLLRFLLKPTEWNALSSFRYSFEIGLRYEPHILSMYCSITSSCYDRYGGTVSPCPAVGGAACLRMCPQFFLLRPWRLTLALSCFRKRERRRSVRWRQSAAVLC